MHKEKLQIIKRQWDFNNIECIYKKNNNSVYSAYSPHWGSVIIKENLNIDELTKEYSMLKQLDGFNACRVYAIDMLNCLIVEEQIIPGITLRNESNMSKRVNSFLKLFSTIHKDVSCCQCDETYLDWIRKANEFCTNNKVEEKVTVNINKAYQIGCDIFQKYKDRVLLHGDLHHDNILLGESDNYYIIDPKGVVGPAIFDLPRYILNELYYVSINDYKNHIIGVVSFITNNTCYSFVDIIKVFFIEVLLANVWNIEDGEEPDYHQIDVVSELLCEFQ